MKQQFLLLFLFLSTCIVFGQQGHERVLLGKVVSMSKEGKEEGLPGVYVFWEGTSLNATTDKDGSFEIEQPEKLPARLVASFIGYKPETLIVRSPEQLHKRAKFYMYSDNNLDAFTVKARKKSSFISLIDTRHVEHISEGELKRAACCNLSESFENSASVDVVYADAVSGMKKIQMLGLDGVYTQIQFENLPLIRGLSSGRGLGFVPGTWVESIQVNKGAGSVVNGYESVTGQINLELKKPDEAEKIYLNVYSNLMGRYELNLHGSSKVNDKWSTMTFAHASTMQNVNDHNNDGFLDIPKKDQFNVFHRWKYFGDKLATQFGGRVVDEKLTGGQLGVASAEHTPYKVFWNTRMYDGFWKGGLLFPDVPYKSVAFLSRARYSEQSGGFGGDLYSGTERFANLSVVYQTLIHNSFNKVKVGGSFLYNAFEESYAQQQFSAQFVMNREEIVPGAFAEYTYSNDSSNHSLVVGLRGDYHNMFGAQVMPRMNYRYQLSDNSVIRLSGGRGFRVPNPLVENSNFLASSRQLWLSDAIQPEIAWNYGISYTYSGLIASREASITADFFRTDFENQWVVDLEDVDMIRMYNLNGSSFANSFQIEGSIAYGEWFETRGAYKFYDVQRDYLDGRRTVPFVQQHRVLLTQSVKTRHDKWVFDITWNLHGPSRVPSTAGNDPENVRPELSDWYSMINMQISKNFRRWELYLGAENLLDYKQPNAIVAANDPFGSQFDAAMVWAPVNGRNIYAGARFFIKRKKR